jgi:pimeloyl-ACP methyl ester carboxylesterase
LDKCRLDRPRAAALDGGEGSTIRAMPRQVWPPEPPIQLPPARTVQVAGRGEFFLRDSGPADGPVLMLLHGWIASADLNWAAAYGDLIAAGYRVLAIDHRGHGRGLRSLAPFRLADCAADAAAVLRELKTGPATIVGYSMGGAIAQLVAHQQPDVVAGIVLSGTAQHWQDPADRRAWRAMGALGLTLQVAPRASLRAGLKQVGLQAGPQTAWLVSELTRHSSRDIAEAGRELGRFDSRPWLGSVTAPAAVVLTARDSAVSPRKQRELAQACNATVFEVPLDHLELTTKAAIYNPALLEAIEAVGERQHATVA